MDEKALFNKDVMYWREVNIMSSDNVAIVQLINPIKFQGALISELKGMLSPFESQEVVYEMENGGAFKKNEVQNWPFKSILSADNTSEGNINIEHDNLKSITLLNEQGQVILTKAKI